MKRNTTDERLRELERRASTSGSRDDLKALARARERADGAVSALERELGLMISYDWRQNIEGHENSDELNEHVTEGVASTAHIARSVIRLEGHYGMISGTPGEGEGLADFYWDDRGEGVLDTIVVWDNERDMVTIGIRRDRDSNPSDPSQSASFTFWIWPDFVGPSELSSRRHMRIWWDDIANHGLNPRIWRTWSRARYELAITPDGIVYDRVRVPRSTIERWLLLMEAP